MKKILFVFAAFAALSLVSCNKGGEQKVDPTGGVDVAADNLVVYLSFDDEKVQLGKDISFTEKKGAADLGKGARGKAYTNTGAATSSEAYFVYTLGENNPFKTLSDFTVSCWIKCPMPVADTPGTGAFLSLNGGDATMGSFTMFREGWGGESLAMKCYFFDAASADWKGQDLALQKEEFEVDNWFLFAWSYDSASSTMFFWSNGKKVGDSIRYAGPVPEGGGEQPLLGALSLKGDETKLYIGGWATAIEGTAQDWMGFYPGGLDELRIFNKALSEEEMLALYRAEAGNLD